MMATKYKTITGKNAEALDQAVSELLEEGYSLYGNPYTTDNLFCQALVVNETPNPDIETAVKKEPFAA
jgi:hypothetical protein